MSSSSSCCVVESPRWFFEEVFEGEEEGRFGFHKKREERATERDESAWSSRATRARPW